MAQSSNDLYNVTSSVQTTTLNNNTSKPATQSGNEKTQFKNTLAKYVSVSEDKGTGIKAPIRPEGKSIPKMAEQMRVNAAASRLKLITSLLKAEEKEKKPYDVQSKCMDIAKRIMRGKKVSAEEMRFLLKNDPGLYFLAILFRSPENSDEDEIITNIEGEQASTDDGAAGNNASVLIKLDTEL